MATVFEGTILTVDDQDTVARYLVVERDKIVHVGTDLPRRYERHTRVDLGSRVLCPSFADTHIHLSGYALHLAGYDQKSNEGAEPSAQDLAECIQHAVDHLAERGIGMVITACGVGLSNSMDISLERWMAKSVQGGFQIRVLPQSMSVTTAMRRRLPRIGGCFANALDGRLETGDAALLEPSEAGWGSPNALRYDDDELVAFCREAHKANLQIQLHAVGDAAFDQAVRAISSAESYWPRSNCRPGIIHACLPTEEGLRECARMGVHLPMQVVDLPVGHAGGMSLEEALPPDLARRYNPLRSIVDSGVRISAGSDAPRSDPDPIDWMYRACNHHVPEQSLTPQEALRMCTYNGYWATFCEDERGSLEVGKIADMCVLSGNPYEVPAEELGSLRVEQLILGGKPYTGQKQGRMAAVIMGIVGTGYC